MDKVQQVSRSSAALLLAYCGLHATPCHLRSLTRCPQLNEYCSALPSQQVLSFYEKKYQQSLWQTDCTAYMR